MKFIKKICLFTSLLCWSATIYSQDGFIVFGNMKLENGKLDGKIEVFVDGQRERVLQADGSGKFEFDLKYDHDYILSFSQDGYVTKKITINTNVPDERKEFGFAPFEFEVTLFKQYEGINFMVFNQPVGRIMFSGEVDDFDYDTDYTKSIQQRLEEVEKEVEKAAKEEEKREKEKEKQEPEPEEPKPEIKEDISIKREAPPTTPRRKIAPPPPPTKRKGGNIVVLHSYTVGELGYPNLNAYGFINFGDGAGRREISKEQFDEYAKMYH